MDATIVIDPKLEEAMIFFLSRLSNVDLPLSSSAIIKEDLTSRTMRSKKMKRERERNLSNKRRRYHDEEEEDEEEELFKNAYDSEASSSSDDNQNEDNYDDRIFGRRRSTSRMNLASLKDEIESKGISHSTSSSSLASSAPGSGNTSPLLTPKSATRNVNRDEELNYNKGIKELIVSFDKNRTKKSNPVIPSNHSNISIVSSPSNSSANNSITIISTNTSNSSPTTTTIKEDTNKKTTSWQERFENLKEFKKITGHCNVSASGDTLTLGRWVHAQRFKKKNGKLNIRREVLLNAIDFSWELKSEVQSLNHHWKFDRERVSSSS